MLVDTIFVGPRANNQYFKEGVRDFFMFRKPYFIFGGGSGYRNMGSESYYDGYDAAAKAFKQFLIANHRFPNENESGYPLSREGVRMATEKQIAMLDRMAARAPLNRRLGIDHRAIPMSLVNMLMDIYKGL